MDDLIAKLEDLGVDAPLKQSDLTQVKGVLLAKILLTKLSHALELLDAPEKFTLPSGRWTTETIVGLANHLGSPTGMGSDTEALITIDFLAAELQDANIRLSAAAQYAKEHSTDKDKIKATDVSGLELGKQQHSSSASILYIASQLCKILHIPMASVSNVRDTAKIVQQVLGKIKLLVSKMPPGRLTATDQNLLQANEFTAQQRDALDVVNKHMRTEYALRREMLLKRLDVTIQSFLWSAAVEDQHTEVLNSIRDKRRALSSQPAEISVEDVLEVGPELAVIASSRVTGTPQTATIKSVIIGQVPDRGGRVHEQKPSARDMMPGWAKRSVSSGSKRGRGGKRNGRGGRGGHTNDGEPVRNGSSASNNDRKSHSHGHGRGRGRGKGRHG